MEENHKTNGWLEYKERVIYQLDKLDQKTDEIQKTINALRDDVVVLKTKAGLYGAVGSFIVLVVIEIVKVILTHGKVI